MRVIDGIGRDVEEASTAAQIMPAPEELHAERRRLETLRWIAWRGLVMSAGLAVLSVLVVAVHPDVRHFVMYRLMSDQIGAPETTSAVPAIETRGSRPTRVAVAGDVGTGAAAARDTADAMDLLESESEYDALVLLGDNVYPNGDPERLTETIFDPFAGVLDERTQLLAVLGNHDVRDGNRAGHVSAIGMPGPWYATRVGHLLVLSLDSTRPDDPEQLEWLKSTLAENDASWTVATMHHPPYSAGYHGSSLGVRTAFVPIFEEYGVQLVLAGHDHDYQRSQPINGITYIVTGAAAKLRPANQGAFTEVAWSTYHFVDLAAWPDHLEVRAIDQSGRLFDAVTLRQDMGQI